MREVFAQLQKVFIHFVIGGFAVFTNTAFFNMLCIKKADLLYLEMDEQGRVSCFFCLHKFVYIKHGHNKQK